MPGSPPELDARPLAWGRIAFGVLFLLRTTPLLAAFHFDFAIHTYPLLGWPVAGFRGTAFGVELPAWMIAGACILRTLGALAFVLGAWTRASGIVAGVCGYLVMLQDPFGFIATLHLLYQGIIVLALTDAGSLMALRPVPPRAVRSSFFFVRAFLASIYFWAAFVKLRPDWLDGRTLELYRADGALSGPFSDLVLSTPAMRTLIAWSIASTELVLPLLLFLQRTRRVAPFVALGLHGVIELCARPDLLGWEMAALLLCLWPVSDTPRMLAATR